MNIAEQIAQGLDNRYRVSGDGYVCCCPSHSDTNASLKVTLSKTGMILVHCHAKCPQETVIAEIQARGLWPSYTKLDQPKAPQGAKPAPVAKAPKPKRTLTHTYDYHDHLTGGLVMQAMRYEPKDFLQRRPDPARPGEWTWKVPSEFRTLYNAPAAFKASGVILVVEGEKDVDNLTRLGIVAVCNSGGAGKWLPLYNEILTGKDIILVPDNDPQKVNKNTGALMWHPDGRPVVPGQDHMDLVGAALQGIASRVRILHLPNQPEKGDVTDWINAGGTREQLIELCKETTDWTPPVVPEFTQDLMQPLDGRFDEPAPPEEQPDKPQIARPANDNNDEPFQCLGYNHGSYFYLPRGQQQVVELIPSAHTKANLLALAELYHWELKYAGKRGFNVDAAANDMIRACVKKGVWSPADIRGRGSWLDQSRIVVHCGNMLYVDRTPMAPSQIVSRYVYELGQAMPLTIDNPLTTAEASLYLDHMRRLPFGRDLDAVMMAGWTVCAHIGGVLPWRPHVWLVGAKGTGKSYVMDRVVKSLFGPDRCLAVASSTTEAGLRQSLGSDAIPVLFDEAEGQDHTAVQRIQRILETVRQSSSETGAKIAKGTSGGTAMAFSIRSCFMFASINSSIVQESDRSRISVLELKPDKRKHDLAELNRFGEFLLDDTYAPRYQARAVDLAPVILHNCGVFSAVAAAEFSDQRAGDQYGALLAGAYSLVSDEKATVAQAEEWIKQFDLSADKADVAGMLDEDKCLSFILQQLIKGVEMSERKFDLTIGELVDKVAHPKWDGDEKSHASCAKRALGRLGLKVSNDGERLIVSNTADGLKRLLKDTPWGSDWRTVLARLPDAKKLDSTHFGYVGSETRAVSVPLPKAVISSGME